MRDGLTLISSGVVFNTTISVLNPAGCANSQAVQCSRHGDQEEEDIVASSSRSVFLHACNAIDIALSR